MFRKDINIKLNIDKVYGDTNKSIKCNIKDFQKAINRSLNVIPIKDKFDNPLREKITYNDDGSSSFIQTYFGGTIIHRASPYAFHICATSDSTTRKVLDYIYYNLPYNSNRLQLNAGDVCKKLNIHSRNFYIAMSELDAKHLVYKTNRNEIYSINPLHLFKGDISKFITEYKKKYGDEDTPLDKKGRIIIEI